MNRRKYLAMMGATAGAVAASSLVTAQDPGAPSTSTIEDRKRRMTTFALECDSEPKQNHEMLRAEKPRDTKY